MTVGSETCREPGVRTLLRPQSVGAGSDLAAARLWLQKSALPAANKKYIEGFSAPLVCKEPGEKQEGLRPGPWQEGAA